MSSKRLFLILLLLVTQALSQTPRLRMVIVLTRHGVRSPLSSSTSSLNPKQPWPSLPDWNVPCSGYLTPRGTELVRQMGIFYHAYYADKGLLVPVNQCPASQVYIWSDNVERTLSTSEALVDGMKKGVAPCLMAVNSLPYTPPPKGQCTAKNLTDYFFHPQSLLKPDPSQLSDVAAKINQEVSQLLITYHPALQMMQTTLCNRSPPPCNLFNLPYQAKADDKDKSKDKDKDKLSWDGIFSMSSTATENFLLEYGNG